MRLPFVFLLLLTLLSGAACVAVTPATDTGALVLAAQSTVECGPQGRAGCFNYNVSNIMGTSPEGFFHVLQAPEGCDFDFLQDPSHPKP